ncbi:MAG: hypothetical protein M3R13_06360 [Armatimonadota bacterium]|nr:hypothetical protein [Armatimonadota bacterium]
MKNSILGFLFALALTIAVVAGCGGGGSGGGTGPFQVVLVESPGADPQNIIVGEEVQFVLAGYKAGGGRVVLQATSWSVLDNPNVGTINPLGIFTALAAGEARIGATWNGSPAPTPLAIRVKEDPELQIVARIESLLADANSENITQTMENYSQNYCDDVDFCGGGTYQEERDCWVNTFTDPTSSVSFSNLRVVDVQVNQTKTEGYIDAIVHFTVRDQFGAVIGEDDYSFRMHMEKEFNEWVMIGDGNCADTIRNAIRKWTRR